MASREGPEVARLSRIGRSGDALAARMDRLSEGKFALVAFGPAAILVGLFVVPPIVAVFGMSLFRIELLKDSHTPFVGLGNFARLLSDSQFLAAVPRTLLFGAGTTLLVLPIALGCALLLNRGFRGASLMSVALLLPWAVAPVVTGLFWKFMFQSNFGLATGLATAVGLTNKPIDWLFDERIAMSVAIVANAWRSLPIPGLLLLAALKNVPPSLYHAARVDGATGFQAFRFVTLPAIRNMLMVVTIYTVVTSLQSFDLLFTLTGGGPGRETTVVSYYIFQNITDSLSFGYGSAMAIVLLAFIALCSALLLLTTRLLSSRSEKIASNDYAETALTPIPPAPSPNGAPSWTTNTSSTRSVPLLSRTIKAVITRIGVPLATASLFLWLLGPIAWIALSSTQPEGAITQAPPHLTTDFQFDGYIRLWTDPRWIHSIVISVVVAATTSIVSVVLAAVAAYPLARYALRGKRIIVGALLLTQMLPEIVFAVPTLLVFRALGLVDTVLGLILVNVAFVLPLIIWWLGSVFAEIPRALESAARVDGCSRVGALFRVTIPVAAPGLVAVAVIVLIGTWNEFVFAVILGNTEAVTVTRQIGFVQALHLPSEGAPPYTLLAAAGITAILPCLVPVVLLNRRITAGVTRSFMKG